MSVSYKKLWKLLIDKDMKKKDLQTLFLKYQPPQTEFLCSVKLFFGYHIQRRLQKLLVDYSHYTLVSPAATFPCQDISVAGYQKGLHENSGTRSSLLWECCKIIEAKKPKFLMMENVKNLVGSNHKHNFDKYV